MEILKLAVFFILFTTGLLSANEPLEINLFTEEVSSKRSSDNLMLMGMSPDAFEQLMMLRNETKVSIPFPMLSGKRQNIKFKKSTLFDQGGYISDYTQSGEVRFNFPEHSFLMTEADELGHFIWLYIDNKQVIGQMGIDGRNIDIKTKNFVAEFSEEEQVFESNPLAIGPSCSYDNEFEDLTHPSDIPQEKLDSRSQKMVLKTQIRSTVITDHELYRQAGSRSNLVTHLTWLTGRTKWAMNRQFGISYSINKLITYSDQYAPDYPFTIFPTPCPTDTDQGFISCLQDRHPQIRNSDHPLLDPWDRPSVSEVGSEHIAFLTGYGAANGSAGPGFNYKLYGETIPAYFEMAAGWQTKEGTYSGSAIMVYLHELGHNMGAPHTFQDNWIAERKEMCTVMDYCNNWAIFHCRSIDEKILPRMQAENFQMQNLSCRNTPLPRYATGHTPTSGPFN